MLLSELLSRCKQNDPKAYSRFYKLFAEKMYRVCRRYVSNEMTAEELLMNGFLKFFDSLHRFHYSSDAETEAYLRITMVTQCLNWLDIKNNFLVSTIEDLPEVKAEDDIIAGLSAKEIIDQVSRLPVGYRTVLNLYAFEDQSHEQIAKLLGISIGTSHSQLNKARKLLKKRLSQNNNQHERQISK